MNSADLKFSGVVAALPGYFLLGRMEGHNGFCLDSVLKDPILAFAIEEESYAPFPIVYDGIDTQDKPVLFPCGTVMTRCERWDSLDDWFLSEQEDWDALRKQERYTEFLKQHGVDATVLQTDKPVSATTAIKSALEAARRSAVQK